LSIAGERGKDHSKNNQVLSVHIPGRVVWGLLTPAEPGMRVNISHTWRRGGPWVIYEKHPGPILAGGHTTPNAPSDASYTTHSCIISEIFSQLGYKPYWVYPVEASAEAAPSHQGQI